MSLSRTRLVLAVAPLLWACGGAGEPEPGAEGEIEAVPIAGRYEVKGTTIAVESGHKRQIAGTIILAEQGDRYTATFSLVTTYPGADQALPAEVIGKGEGAIEGRTLRGTASTQLVMATVPGVDPGFAFVPRMVSTRIASDTVATVAADGTVSIEIENRPAPGADYSPTRTMLTGHRIAEAGVGAVAGRSAGGK